MPGRHECIDRLGAALQQWTCAGTDNQKFRLMPVAGRHAIIVKNGGLGLSVPGMPASLLDGAPIVKLPFSGAAGQTWQVVVTPDGYQTLASVNSGNCLEVAGSAAANGAEVHQLGCAGTDDEKWHIGQ